MPDLMRRRLLTLLAIAGCFGAAAAAVAGANGHRPRVRPGAAARAAAATGRPCPIPERYRAAFAAAADETNLPLALLTALAHAESRFRAGATSPAGARGLFQIMPVTAAELKLSADDPASNVLAGARYLKRMLNRFSSTDLALAAYNAGPTAVARTGGAPNVQTLTYVQNATDSWRLLHGCS